MSGLKKTFVLPKIPLPEFQDLLTILHFPKDFQKCTWGTFKPLLLGKLGISQKVPKVFRQLPKKEV